jgi:peptide/nickel transport system substrate-binding protein
MIRRLGLTVPLVAAALAFGLAACGGDDEDEGGGGGGGTIIHGTTDPPVSYDPAGSYDLPSWNIIYNTHSFLLQIAPGGNQPEPDAAESCDFTDPRTFECTLKPGLKFSDGSALTAEDVVFSFERNLEIADPQGASSLYTNMRSVEAPDERTVVFELKQPDSTWPFRLTTGGAGIVPSDAYSATKIQRSDEIVASGRYVVARFQPGQQTVLEPNPEYTGDDPAQNTVLVQQFDTSSALKLAVEEGEVDIAYRSLAPTEIEDLRAAEGVEVVQGNGTEIRYIVFNLEQQPGDSAQQKEAIRKAVAMTVDRQAIAENVYNDTVRPLYSMVPEGLAFHVPAFADVYGEEPDPDGAERVLSEAGVQTPVRLKLWWTPSHYGPGSADEYTEIKRQLDGSRLFQVSLDSTEWNQYSEAAFTDRYPAYQLGWFPDYPDADNYTTSFYSEESFLNHHYSNQEMERLLSQQQQTTTEDERAEAFDQIQQIGADDAPTIPIWQGDQIAAVRDGIEGVEDTFDPSFQFRYWLISK